MTHTTDIEGNPVVLPQIGDKVLRDGYEYSVREVQPSKEIGIIAGIILKGPGSNEVSVGYYDYLNHKKA